MIEEKSTCKKRKVSAIIVDDNKNILGIGVNTPIIGNTPCCRRLHLKSGSCPTECNAVHAEVMAIINAKQNLIGSTIYISDSPCINCARIIAASGIKKVCYDKNYYDENSNEFNEVIKIFENYNVEFEKCKLNL